MTHPPLAVTSWMNTRRRELPDFLRRRVKTCREAPRDAPWYQWPVMRIALKLTLSLIIPLAALIATIGYLFQRGSEQLLREELRKEGRAIALVVQTASEDYLQNRQLADLRELVDRINR